MKSIHELLKHHKKTVFFTEQIAIKCLLKPPSSDIEYKVNGLTSFIGLTITESGAGVFADSFEITLNIDEVSEYTEIIPARNWGIVVFLPQLGNKPFSFIIENVATDRTLGLYLIKCSSCTPKNKTNNKINGGI